MFGYCYHMDVYLGKDRTCANTYIIATLSTVKQLSKKAVQCGRNLYMDNYFFSLDLFEKKNNISCYGAVRPNKKGLMPWISICFMLFSCLTYT
jgi:hypothetical protein